MVLGMMKRHEHPLLTEEMSDLFAAVSSHSTRIGTAEYSVASSAAGVGDGAATRLRIWPSVIVTVAM